MRALPFLRGALLLAALLAVPCVAADPVATTRAGLLEAMRASAAAPRATTIARAEFHRPPPIVDVQLAPDGRRLSFLALQGERVDVIVQDVATGRQTRVIADARDVDTAWSGDGRRLWVADADGLAVIDAAALQPKRILNWDERRGQRFHGVDPRAPRFAIVQETLGQGGRETQRYLRIDADGATRLLHESAFPLRSLLLAADGTLAFAAAYDGPDYDTAIRAYTPTGVRELLRCTGVEFCSLVGFDPRSKTLFLLSHHGEDTLALQRWREADARWETVHRDPQRIADSDGVLFGAARGDWLAIAYDHDRRHWYGNDAATRTVIATLQRRLPGASLDLQPSADGRLWLVREQRAAWRHDRYHLYRAAGERLQPLFADPAPLTAAAMHPVSWRGRDGMLLHGFVLLPSGRAPGAVPLVAWLHGGPVARIGARYDPSVQLLVNRGHAVFVPNFRGSSGYGRRYALAAQGDVGDGKVLADILDGLDHLLALGIGDRDRQAVMGHSFGGYASLVAATHQPGRFAFAAAAAPPVDYGWIKQWQSEHDAPSLRGDGPPLALQFAQYGFRFEDAAWRAKMRRESPLAQVAQVQVPIYLWAGTRDDRVPLASIAHYAGQARTQHVRLSLLIDPDAGHVPREPLAAEALLYLWEAAADRHFGGGTTPPSAELQTYLRRNLRIDDAGLQAR